MSKLERYKKELLGLKDRVKLLEELIGKEKGNKNGVYPKIGETYYFVEMCGEYGTVAEVSENTWDGDEIDLFYWDFQHGSTDKAKVEWTIEHIELVNEIKKYTRPFIIEKENVFFVRDFKNGVGVLNKYWLFDTDFNSSYGYFESENEINKFRENYTEKYVLNFLFEPVDGNYKAAIDWLLLEREG